MNEVFKQAENIVDDLKDQIVLNGCVGKMAMIGMAGGSIVKPGLGTVVGAAGGAIWGAISCPKLKEPLKKKLFDKSAYLKPAESAELFQEFEKATGSYKKGVHIVSLVKGGHLPVKTA